MEQITQTRPVTDTAVPGEVCDVEDGVQVSDAEGHVGRDIRPALGVGVPVEEVEAGHVHRQACTTTTRAEGH